MPSTDPSQPCPPTTKRQPHPTKFRTVAVRTSKLISALIDAEVKARNLPSVTSFVELATLMAATSPESRAIIQREVETNPSLVVMFAAYTPVHPPRESVRKLLNKTLKENDPCQDSSQI